MTLVTENCIDMATTAQTDMQTPSPKPPSAAQPESTPAHRATAKSTRSSVCARMPRYLANQYTTPYRMAGSD